MLNSLQILRLAALALALPAIGLPAAISVNGTCYLGTCAAPDSITFGTELTAPFSYNVSVGSDTYKVSGTYDTGYTAVGTFINFFPTVTYTGSMPSTSTDTLSVNLYQNIFDNSPGTFDGVYEESVPLTLTSGVSASAQAFYDGQGVGLVGPLSGPGSYNVSKSANLTGLTGSTLTGLYTFTFTFQASSVTGSTGGSTVSLTPEPSQTMPMAAGLLGLTAFAFRRRKQR